jgi:hypothetical protein
MGTELFFLSMVLDSWRVVSFEKLVYKNAIKVIKHENRRLRRFFSRE